MRKDVLNVALFGALVFPAALLGPQPAPGATVLAKKGAEVDATLQQSLSSKTNHDGDTFQLSEKDTFFHRNAALNGAVVEGHLENVTAASPTHKATMSVLFDDVKLPDGSTVPFRATVISLKTFEPKTHLLRDTGLVIGSAVAGHMLAKRTGLKHGGVAGAAAGIALASGLKSDVSVKKGTIVKLRLEDDLIAQQP